MNGCRMNAYVDPVATTAVHTFVGLSRVAGDWGFRPERISPEEAYVLLVRCNSRINGTRSLQERAPASYRRHPP